MKATSQSGFAVGAAIGIVAILALLGGGAYVAKHAGQMASSTNATSTESMDTDATSTMNTELDVMGGADVDADATTSIDAGVDAGAGMMKDDTAGNVNVEVNGNLDY